MKVKGGGADSHLEILAYIFYPCSLPTGCATKEEMAEIGVVYSFPSTAMNLSNYHRPIQNYLNADNFVFVNTAMRQKFQGKLSVTEVYDDPGLYFPLELKSNVSSLDRIITTTRSRDPDQIQCTVQQMVADTCSSYLVFDYMSSGKKMKIVRQYKGLVETISDLGGVNSIVFLLFLWANYTYVEVIQQKHLVHKVFDFFNEKLFTAKPARKSRLLCCKKINPGLAKPGAAFGSQSSITSKTDPDALEPAVVKNLQEQAYKMIENSLDIVTLVKEINSLKVLTHFLLKDYHLKLVPLISLSLQCSKTKANLFGDARPPRSSTLERDSHVLGRRETVLDTAPARFRNVSYQQALLQLQAAGSQAQVPSPKPPAGSEGVSADGVSLESRIDNFCINSLAGGHLVFSELMRMNLQDPRLILAAGTRVGTVQQPPSEFEIQGDPEAAHLEGSGGHKVGALGASHQVAASHPHSSQPAFDSSKGGFRPAVMNRKSLKLKVKRSSVAPFHEQEDQALH
jgi:hypothetical protein